MTPKKTSQVLNHLYEVMKLSLSLLVMAEIILHLKRLPVPQITDIYPSFT